MFTDACVSVYLSNLRCVCVLYVCTVLGQVQYSTSLEKLFEIVVYCALFIFTFMSNAMTVVVGCCRPD